MARSWVEQGLMQGNPPPEEARVTLDDYDKGQHPRWSMLHMRQLVPSARVAARRGAPPLPRELRDDLLGLAFEHEGAERTVAELLDETYVDALMVVHRGRVVLEHYDDGVGPESRHIAQSVTKSVVATVAGICIDRGLLDPARAVTSYLPELAGTSWDGATVQQLLDMRTATSFDESDYEDPESESMRGFRILGWLTRRPDDPLPQEYIAALPNEGEHGGRFEYRSILTDVIGWVLERVTGTPLATLLSETLWAPMGAEHDADLLVGPLSFPLASGGLCLTVADLARVGLLHLDGGVAADGTRVLSSEWVASITDDRTSLAESFAADVHADTFPAGAFYHQQWWVLDPSAGVFTGLGIHGQQVLVHPPSQTVVAKFSSWPRPIDDDHVAFSAAALDAICAHLTG